MASGRQRYSAMPGARPNSREYPSPSRSPSPSPSHLAGSRAYAHGARTDEPTSPVSPLTAGPVPPENALRPTPDVRSPYYQHTNLLGAQQTTPTRSSATEEPKELPHLPRKVGFVVRIRHRLRRLMRGWWAWELTAATISLAATVALVVLLFEVNGKPQPSWTVGQTQLTLNAIVAVISTIMRSTTLLAVGGALNQSGWNWFSSKRGSPQHSGAGRPLKDLETFGEASTDTWNSVKLLYKTRGRRLASLGAIVVVLSFFFDAFVQQLLSVNAVQSPVLLSGDNLAMSNVLPRAEEYMKQALQAPNLDASIAPLGITAAISNTVSDADSNPTPPGATCPTGNCTWPATPTLGVCSTCADIKNQLITNSSTSTINYTLQWDSSTYDRQDFNTTLSFTLDLVGEATTDVYLLDSAAVSFGPDSGRATIASFYALGISPSSYSEFYSSYGAGESLTVDDLNSLVVAYNCSFYFCLQAYSAHSTSGNMNQTSDPTPWDQTSAMGLEGASLDSRIHYFTDVPSSMNVANGSVYQFGEDSFRAMGRAFASTFYGDVQFISNYEALSFDGPSESERGRTLNAQSFYDASGSLANMTNLTSAMATSLTSYMRNKMPAALDAQFAPTVLEQVLLVDVRWQWLSYPLVVVLGGQIFLLITIWHTSRLHVRPWKGHRVPLLLADVDDSVRRIAVGGLDRRTGLDDRVGEIKVRLDYDGHDSVVFQRVSMPQRSSQSV